MSYSTVATNGPRFATVREEPTRPRRPLTLLSINNYFYRRGGSEAVYFAHNALFQASGWTVVPFAMRHAENASTPWSTHFVDEIEYGVSYSLVEKLKRLPKVLYSFESRRKLSAILARVQPDIAHCHSIYHHLSPSILRPLKRRGIPIVMTLHDLKLACPAYRMFHDQQACEECKGGRLHRVVANRCIKQSAALSAIVLAEALLHRWLASYSGTVDRFIVPSRFYLEKLVDWGLPRDRFVHVPNFVDCDSIAAGYAPGRAFLYFGRLSPEKGVATLIDAAARAAVPLWIAGAGPQRGELERRAERLGADVTFLGRLDGARLRDAIRAARMTVLPSEWYENAPLAALESLAAGKPVIGAAIGGIPEIVTNGETGWLFAPRSVAALASALRAAAAAPDARIEAMGRAARLDVERRFAAPVYGRRLRAVYAELGVLRPAVVA